MRDGARLSPCLTQPVHHADQIAVRFARSANNEGVTRGEIDDRRGASIHVPNRWRDGSFDKLDQC